MCVEKCISFLYELILILREKLLKTVMQRCGRRSLKFSYLILLNNIYTPLPKLAVKRYSVRNCAKSKRANFRCSSHMCLYVLRKTLMEHVTEDPVLVVKRNCKCNNSYRRIRLRQCITN